MWFPLVTMDFGASFTPTLEISHERWIRLYGPNSEKLYYRSLKAGNFAVFEHSFNW